LSALGFNIFFENRNSFYRRIVIGSTSFLILGCILLATILPGRAYSNSVLALTSFTMMIFIVLIFSGQISKKFLFNTLFALIVISSIFFQYLIINYHPHSRLKGEIYTNSMNSGIVALRNKEDHSLYFSMERPAFATWMHNKPGHEVRYNTPAGNTEYSSFINLTDSPYKFVFNEKGVASYPITKDYFSFLSLPGQNELLKKKFHFFNRIIPISMVSYARKLKRQPELTKKLLNEKIGIVTSPEYPSSPIYLNKDALDTIDSMRFHNPESANDFNVKVVRFKANNIELQVTTKEEGVLAYTDSWDEGWHATVDGVPVTVLRVFKIFKGIELSAGIHQVKFYFTNGMLWSLITMNITYFIILFVTAGGIIMRCRSARKS